ncbi:hypothetical protein YC2023_074358 [Brassica napus]
MSSGSFSFVSGRQRLNKLCRRRLLLPGGGGFLRSSFSGFTTVCGPILGRVCFLGYEVRGFDLLEELLNRSRRLSMVKIKRG